ncbi:alpha/beta hydrolase [Brachybacterium fresconis]|uniref:S-formylglutathione hydrolase FrmB n=1 Tax=Brachybacterium fresconis TaxID=173363 RepID=A0ABS4YPH9_9MICO|nr:alpha/beta hydrolase family protein [Brachybacterium fresconis]MBP2409858.1 S-formylglutathione hydrolase FrmB [Brachybacterium fresconis]
MIRMRTDFFSESLGMGTSMVVLMPQAASGIGMEGADEPSRGGDHGATVGNAAGGAADGGAVSGGAADGSSASAPGVPVLYLLHGLSDDCTIWERRTSIERYATGKGIAVVMPEVRRSFYSDEAVGERYWTFVAEELPELVARTFRISTAREDTFVAGLSMGGFGAFKLALNHPERFAAAASLSGALDPASLGLEHNTGHLAERVWGGRDLAGTADDLLGRFATADPLSLPALFLDCGTEDALLEQNRRFIETAETASVDLTSRLRPGDHSWEFWDQGIQDVLDWLPLRG